MEQIKELTRRLLTNSFKEILLQMPFEKITVKIITDHANVIRPTFYNHFRDKYELVEFILKEEILEDAKQCMINGKREEAVDTVLTGFYVNRAFYKKAFDEIKGQNGFAETLHKNLTKALLTAFEGKKTSSNILTERNIAEYYAGSLVSIIQQEVNIEEDIELEKVLESYKYLMTNSIDNMFED